MAAIHHGHEDFTVPLCIVACVLGRISENLLPICKICGGIVAEIPLETDEAQS
jgi:hypothetical protein